MKEDKKADDVLSYATARLNLGLLIRCADDAVREGDGERIILCWCFFLCISKHLIINMQLQQFFYLQM